MNIPLAERLRPENLNEFTGQNHLIGENSALRNIIESGLVPSMIFWGPPGVGKTTLSNIIAKKLKRPFYSLSAIQSGVKDIRDVLEKAKKDHFFGINKPILFIDEIHRFSKAQQDSLLGAVEKGDITLIGATTENPSFEVINALLSRCQVYLLHPLTDTELIHLMETAIKKDIYLKDKSIVIKEIDALLRFSGGDGRKLLNALEIAVNSQWEKNEIILDNSIVKATIQKNISTYDKNGENHYDIISAFIKSVRGSDPNASIYWLARMLEGGEDIIFIARRLIILASEDIGNANPTALVIANNCFQAVNHVGMPEARIILSQCTIYLATSAKSNSSYIAIDDAINEVRRSGNLPVPLHLRNSPTKMMKDIGYGLGYEYVHNFNGNFIEQDYLPEELNTTKFYDPGENQKEKELRDFLKKRWLNKYNY
ncbi:MAG: replication-associated recombination protein A [Bacteroidota bacterium]|jgi:putative ATPase